MPTTLPFSQVAHGAAASVAPGADSSLGPPASTACPLASAPETRSKTAQLKEMKRLYPSGCLVDHWFDKLPDYAGGPGQGWWGPISFRYVHKSGLTAQCNHGCHIQKEDGDVTVGPTVWHQLSNLRPTRFFNYQTGTRTETITNPAIIRARASAHNPDAMRVRQKDWMRGRDYGNSTENWNRAKKGERWSDNL